MTRTSRNVLVETSFTLNEETILRVPFRYAPFASSTKIGATLSPVAPYGARPDPKSERNRNRITCEYTDDSLRMDG